MSAPLRGLLVAALWLGVASCDDEADAPSPPAPEGLDVESSGAPPELEPAEPWTDVQLLEAGLHNTCATDSEGHAYCWGAEQRNCGPSSIPCRPTARRPLRVEGTSDVVGLLVMQRVCSIDTRGVVLCWGADVDDLFGANTGYLDRPRAIPWGGGATAIGTGGGRLCVIAAGTLRCQADQPGYVDLDVGGPAASVRTFGMQGYGRRADGAPFVFSGRDEVQMRAHLERADGIDLGLGLVCGVRADGIVICQGEGSLGQLGNGARDDHREEAVEVVGLEDVQEVAGFFRGACARRADGRVSCWGRNDRGQLGRPSPASSPEPLEVPDVRDATDLTCGSSHCCARTANHRAWCWGYNEDGQLGIGSTSLSSRPRLVLTPGPRGG